MTNQQPSGLFLLYKEGGMTSQTAVLRVKRLFGAAKAGHTGTLDPMAEGVLPILIGKAVKASDFLLCADKHYRAEMTLGITTDTEDSTGEILTQTQDIPTPEDVLAAIQSMCGESLQTPPMYSAKKIGGQKLCDLARKGQEIERTPVPITVFSIQTVMRSPTVYQMDVHCSKGTFIRTLCANIGKKLGCGAVMSRLVRTESAGYTEKQCLTISALEAMSEEERAQTLLSPEEIFSAFPALSLPPFFARLGKNGLPLYQKKLHSTYPAGEHVRLYDEDGHFFALALSTEAPDEKTGEPSAVLRPVRQF